MTAHLKAAVRAALEVGSAYRAEHKDAQTVVRVERSSTPRVVEPTRTRVNRAIACIKRAQDATGTGGVAWGYRARRPVRSAYPMGSVAPYPETTGYMIPTLIRYADSTGDEDSVSRARRMTDWEVSYGAEPVASSTFVTSQVLFGFIAVCERFGDDRVRTASIRAANWPVSCVDERGRFASGHSHFCAAGAKAYETRAGYALAQLGALLGEAKYLKVASGIADYALNMQQSNGWFAENDLDFHDRPLTHTIGCVMEGLHGLGSLLRRQDCMDSVGRTLDALLPLIQPDGYLAGRLRHDWSPAADWACLTGSPQIAAVFLRMYMQTGNPEYLQAGKSLLGFVCFTQDLISDIPGTEGGIRGSYPFGGDYGQWCVLNWATKFLADSVMAFLETDVHPSATTSLRRAQ